MLPSTRSKLYIVLDIGCVECGESTKIRLVTPDEDDAKKFMETAFLALKGLRSDADEGTPHFDYRSATSRRLRRMELQEWPKP